MRGRLDPRALVPRRVPRPRDPVAVLHAEGEEAGINAILSTPLVAHSQPVGALNIYSRTRGAFSLKEQELASVLATEASVILTVARAERS